MGGEVLGGWGRCTSRKAGNSEFCGVFVEIKIWNIHEILFFLNGEKKSITLNGTMRCALSGCSVGVSELKEI